MRNFKLIIEYEGTRYRGWQRQGNTEKTVSGKIEGVLSRLLEQPITLCGSGRTDAGVHALGQTANFKAETEKTPAEMLTACNAYLPEDIRLVAAEEVPLRFHSRLNALRKTYCYRMYLGERLPVMERHFLTSVSPALQVDAMERAALACVGRHDFQSFCAVKRPKKSTVRTVYACKLTGRGQELQLQVTGDGFLYHMVRILAGTLVEIGEGTRAEDSIPALLAAKDRSQAGRLMPACGLTLLQVEYPEGGKEDEA